MKFLKFRVRRFRPVCSLLSYLTFSPKKTAFLVQFKCAVSWAWKIQLSLSDKCSVVWSWAKTNEGLLVGSSHHIYHLPLHQTFIVFGYLRVYIGKRNTTSKSRYINVKDTPSSYTTEWKFQCVLTIGKAKIANVIQHTRSCSSYWAVICFYFINQPCALYIAFATFFSTFYDVIVVKYF